MDMSRSCHYTIPGCHSPEPLDVFRVLRVVVQKQGNISSSKSSSGCNDSFASIDIPGIWPFTFETFVPELVRQRESTNSLRERMERMRETFSKVVAFLRISGKFPPLTEILDEISVRPFRYCPAFNRAPCVFFIAVDLL